MKAKFCTGHESSEKEEEEDSTKKSNKRMYLSQKSLLRFLNEKENSPQLMNM